MTIAFQLAVFALIVTSSILLISVPVVFASFDGWSSNKNVEFLLNTIGWVTFYWHWKHITLWQGNVSQFNKSSTYLMGWLRDYLWLNSSQLINGL